MSTVERPAQRKSPEARSREIAASARLVALELGLDAVTLKSVGHRAAVAPSLVAYYFPSIDELIVETFRSIAAGELSELMAVLDSIDSAAARLRTLINWLLNDARLDVTVVWLDSLILGKRNLELAAEVRTQLDAWQETVTREIDAGVRNGEFQTSQPELIAAHILSLIDGLNAHAIVKYHDQTGLSGMLRSLVERELGLPERTLRA